MDIAFWSIDCHGGGGAMMLVAGCRAWVHG